MKSIKTTTILFALMLTFKSYSQEFLKPLIEKKNEYSLTELQKSFHNWSKNKDLDKEKGWKAFKRWEEFNAQRVNANGKLPDPSINAIEVIKLSNIKSDLKLTGRRTSSWTPVGPSDYPVTNDELLETGLGRINCITFHPSDPNTFWVGVAQGGVWKTINNGESWVPLTDDLPILRISDIAVASSDPETMYISVGDFAYIGFGLHVNDKNRHSHFGLGVYKSTNGGETWNPTALSFDQIDYDGSLTRRVFIDPEDPNHVIAATTTGIWKSTDGGDSWEKKYNELIWDFEKDPNNSNIIYASTGFVNSLQTGKVGVLKSNDFGDTWTSLPINIPFTHSAQRVELSVSPVNSDYVYAVACNLYGGFYGFYMSEDAGATWSKKADSPNILGSYDGQDEEYYGQGTYDLAILADPTDENKVYVGGINMWGSTDNGENWDGISYWLNYFGSSLHGDLHFFAYNPLSQNYYVCSDGGLYKTDDIKIGSWETADADESYNWPTKWQKLSGGINATSFYRIGLSDNNPDYLIAGAQDNSSYFYNKNEWRNFVIGDGMEGLLDPDDPNIILTSTQFGRFSKSTDGGLTFEKGLTSHIVSQEIATWTTPVVRHPGNKNTIYGAWGNLWKSLDGGNTWNKVSNFTNIPGYTFPLPASALAISKVNPNYMILSKRPYYVDGGNMELWKTTNGGVSWNNVLNNIPANLFITDIAMDNDNIDKAWVTASGFRNGQKVYYTENGGNKWLNITDNLPNIPLNTIAHVDGSLENFIYVGTDAGVYYRNDDMEEWELYSNELPNVIVTELEIHESTNKLYASTFGRGIWKVDLMEFTPGEEEITSIGENPFKNMKATVFPNPASSFINLKLENINIKEATLEIVNIKGQSVLKESLIFSGNVFSKRLKLDLKYGLYYLKVSNTHFTYASKFLIE